MKAGIDFGTTLTKSVWKKDDDFRFASTADMSLQTLLANLRSNKITSLNVTGINHKNHRDKLKGFKVSAEEGNDHIKNEIALQAKGVKKLLDRNNIQLDTFLLVSIGTGTSYTFVDKDKSERFEIGNPFSGGFIHAMTKILKLENFNKISLLAEDGKVLDTLLKDIIPETDSKFLVANFSRLKNDSQINDICATVLNSVAVSVIRDIMLIDKTKNVPENIIIIGSTISQAPTLRCLIEKNNWMLKKKLHFPKYGEFSLALGAYDMQDH